MILEERLLIGAAIVIALFGVAWVAAALAGRKARRNDRFRQRL